MKVSHHQIELPLFSMLKMVKYHHFITKFASSSTQMNVFSWSLWSQQTYNSRAAGSRKRLYLRRRYILEGRKNPMLSVISYICVGNHPGGCRVSKWCKFFLEPKRWRGALRVQTSSYQAFFETPFTTGVGGVYHLPEKSKNKSPKYAYVVPWHKMWVSSFHTYQTKYKDSMYDVTMTSWSMLGLQNCRFPWISTVKYRPKLLFFA